MPNPANPQSWNRYSYTLNSPVKYTDPSGHRICGNIEEYGQCNIYPSPSPQVPTAPQGGDDTTPWEVGVEWLTGKGPRNHEFRDGDDFIELLKEHEYLVEVRSKVAGRIHRGNYRPGTEDYWLGGIEGVPKYFRDYSTLLTFGQTGNLAVTYLGSYELEYYVLSVDLDEGNAEIMFHAYNESTPASATHPPLIGYTDFYLEKVAPATDNFFEFLFGENGPTSKTTQNFWWTETITYR